MKTVALLFAAAALLATAVVNARATALDDNPAAGGPDAALARNSLGRKLAGGGGGGGGMHDARVLGGTGLPAYDDDEHVLVDINTLRTFGLIGEDFRHVNKATEDAPCMTKAQCAKKKLVCSKKCRDSAGNEAGELHPFAAKCILGCKKCVPTC